MAESYDVKITLGDAQVEINGAQEGVVEIVKALSDLLSAGSRAHSEPPPPPTGSIEAPRSDRTSPVIDARTFFEEKSPKSQNEAVVVATYYLRELAPREERSDTVDLKKIENVLRQAKFKLPKNLKSVLTNTQAAGYFDRVGLGEYKLNPVGWNLVEHTLGSE